jgi:hypothetical protein
MTKQEFEAEYFVKQSVTNDQLVLNVFKIKEDFSTPPIELLKVSEMEASFSPQVISDEIMKQAMALVYEHYKVI